MNKIIQELNLADDFLFAKVMSDKEICRRVLEKILNIKIKKITIPTEQKVIDILLESKSVRLDIYVGDENETIYNIEMQKGKNNNLPKRSRYYQGSMDLDMITKGEQYKNLRKSFVIFICTFDPFNMGRHIYTFENICKEDNNILLGDETTKIFINTKGEIDDVDKEMMDFLRYIENSTDEVANSSNSGLIKAINDKINYLKNDKSMEVEYMTLLEREREKFEEGIEQGIEQQKIKSVKSLLDILDDETISSRLDIPLEKVKELRRELQA